MQIVSGTNTGTGGDKAISGIGFRPRLVIVRHSSGVTYCKRDGSSNDYSFQLHSFGEASNVGYIRTINADGFTLGSAFNGVGTTAWWTAFEADDSVLQVGVYTGNNADNRQITCASGFVPTYVYVGHGNSGTDKGNFWFNPPGGDASNAIAFLINRQSDYIQGTWADGFTVGTKANVTADGQHVFIALKTTAGNVYVSSWDGNNTDNRNITMGDPFQPVFILWCSYHIATNGGRYGGFRDPLHSGDQSRSFYGGDNAADFLQQFRADGFQVGAALGSYYDMNATGYRYAYVAMKSKISGEIFDRAFAVHARAEKVFDKLVPVMARISKAVDMVIPVAATPENNFGASFAIPVHARAERNYDKVIPVAAKPFLTTVSFDRVIAVQARAEKHFDKVIAVEARGTEPWAKDAAGADSWSKEAGGADDWTKETPPVDSWGKA